jgi:hypothetical protein
MDESNCETKELDSDTTQDLGYALVRPEAQNSVSHHRELPANGVFSFVSSIIRHERGLGGKELGPHVQQQADKGVEPLVDMRINLGPLGRLGVLTGCCCFLLSWVIRSFFLGS